MKTKGIIMVVAATLLLSGIVYGCGLPSGMVKPTVSYVPEDWYCSADEPYGTYEEFDGIKAGLIGYTDTVDGDFFMIFYGDVFPELEGKENDPDALIAKATREAGTFEPTENGTMTVAGEPAGWVKGYDPELDWHEMEIVFVKGSTCVDIYTLYESTSEDEVMSLIASIYLPAQ